MNDIFGANTTRFYKRIALPGLLLLLLASASCGTQSAAVGEDPIASSDPRPTTTPGDPKVSGSLDKATVRRVARENRRELNQCYEMGLEDDRALTGQVEVVFSIAPTGGVRVELLTSPTWENANVDSCIRTNIEGWVFPASTDGDPVEVIFPFNFTQQ